MTQAWRITFAYEGDKFTLKSTRKVSQRVPPTQVRGEIHIGDFVELRGANRQVLYCRCITELIPNSMEFPTGDKAHPLRRASVLRRGEIDMLVPALPEGGSVAIVTSRPKNNMQNAPQHGVSNSAAMPQSEDLICVELPTEGEVK